MIMFIIDIEIIDTRSWIVISFQNISNYNIPISKDVMDKLNEEDDFNYTRLKYCSEIASKREDEKGIRKIIFKHDLGENWSVYHKTILESICHDILSVPIKILTTFPTFMIEYDEESTIYA
jgi:hypothetical protein